MTGARRRCGISRRSSIATTRSPATIVRTCCRLGSSTSCRSRRKKEGIAAQLIKNWQINGIGSWISGTPFQVNGDNGLLQQQGGQQTANVTGDPQGGFSDPGPGGPWIDPSLFTQPGNAWGNSGRNAFRGPSNWNVDFSVFRGFPIGGGNRRLEFRAEATNVFNHTQWDRPADAQRNITDANFLRLRTLFRDPRTVQLGLRFQF